MKKSGKAALCAFVFFVALAIGGVILVDCQKDASLNDAAFAAWLSENGRHRLFDNMTDARKAWAFVVYMSHYMEGREKDRESYELFLKKWKIGTEKAGSLTSL